MRRHLLKDHGRTYDNHREQSVAYRGSAEHCVQLQQAQERQYRDCRNRAARRRQREEAGLYQPSASGHRVSTSGQPRRLSSNSETRQLVTGRPEATGVPRASSVYRAPTPVIVGRTTQDHVPASQSEQSPNTLTPCRYGLISVMERSSMISSTCRIAQGGIGRWENQTPSSQPYWPHVPVAERHVFEDTCRPSTASALPSVSSDEIAAAVHRNLHQPSAAIVAGLAIL